MAMVTRSVCADGKLSPQAMVQKGSGLRARLAMAAVVA
jgi:hypothetical protein